MIKKLFTQIYNERMSNIALLFELLVVSVVLWFVVDALYVRYAIYTKPMGMDIDHTYSIKLGFIEPDVPGYHKYEDEVRERNEEAYEILTRIHRRPEVESAAFMIGNAVPYCLGMQSTSLVYDTIHVGLRSVIAEPEYFRVFRVNGSRGETPEEMTEIMNNSYLMASDNALDKYGMDITSMIGKDGFSVFGKEKTYTLSGTFPPIRTNEYSDINNKYNRMVIVNYSKVTSWGANDPIVVRVKDKMDNNFIENLRADAENLRVGNIYISDVQSIKDMRNKALQEQNHETMLYLFGVGFLLLNIFLGLLGTFWFRTQQRRQEIALHIVSGATRRDVLSRLMGEGICMIMIVTPIAVVINVNIAYAELNAVYAGTTLEPMRFALCVAISVLSIIVMMVIGIFIPVRKAMNIQAAEALHGE